MSLTGRGSGAFAGGAAVALVALLAPGEAGAETSDWTQRDYVFEAKFGGWRPEKIDDEDGLKASGRRPFENTFGKDLHFLMEYEAGYILWQKFGTVAVGPGVGYGSAKGNAIFTSTQKKSEETTKFRTVPMYLSLGYRADFLPERYSTPVVPYAKFGFDYHIWWITDSEGDTARVGKKTGRGGEFGIHLHTGAMFLLDFVEPSAATSLQSTWGIDNSFLYFEYQINKIDGLSPGSGMNLSFTTFMGGAAFDF